MKQFNFYEEQVREFIKKFDNNMASWYAEDGNIIDLTDSHVLKTHKIGNVENLFNLITQRCEGLSEEWMVQEYKVPLINLEKLKIYKNILEDHILNNVTTYTDMEDVKPNNLT